MKRAPLLLLLVLSFGLSGCDSEPSWLSYFFSTGDGKKGGGSVDVGEDVPPTLVIFGFGEED